MRTLQLTISPQMTFFDKETEATKIVQSPEICLWVEDKGGFKLVKERQGNRHYCLFGS